MLVRLQLLFYHKKLVKLIVQKKFLIGKVINAKIFQLKVEILTKFDFTYLLFIKNKS